MSPREQMRAAILHNYGDQLRIENVPLPLVQPGHVLVRVQASGVNPLDLKIRVGAAPHARTTLPAILGIDLAGVVEAVADDVSEFTVGDEIFGMTGGVGGLPGSLAEYAAVDADLIALKPSHWTFKQAASAPLAIVTAWEGLIDRAAVSDQDRVLIHGGAGGVGHIAVQLALWRGAQVFATGTSESSEGIRQNGATPIDFTSSTSARYIDEFTRGNGFDIIFDTVGGATLDASFESVRRYTGHVVSILGWGTHDLAPLSFRGATYSGVFALLPLLTGNDRRHHGNILGQAAALAEASQLTPHVDLREFTLSTVREAHRIVAANENRGRIVVDIGRRGST